MTHLSSGSILSAPGFADPARDAQRVFRILLNAMAQPAQPMEMRLTLSEIPKVHKTATALCLALVDLDTPLWMDQDFPAAAQAHFAFHCGCPFAKAPGEAHFALIADGCKLPSLSEFAIGSPEFPDRSATLVIQVQNLSDGGPLVASGPGIAQKRHFGVEGISPDFWAAFAANHALYPLGYDVVLAAPDCILGLPRGIRVEV